MHAADRPRWQQMTALVSLGTGGAMTAFSLLPGSSAADLISPASAHIRLLALQQAARPALTDDGPLRSAIVNVASYYLRMAQGKTPAEMEALIWQHDSIDGIDHGASCAAFASLTLELAAQVTGQQSWVTGGTSYPWPLHKWADVRVDPNPASPGITSILQDAEAHGRWQPLGDGYRPQPGDWVLFDGHVEVVTKDSGGVLHTIGADSLPNLSVNAHAYPDPLAAQGVVGFVNNGEGPAGMNGARGSGGHSPRRNPAPGHIERLPGVATGLTADRPAAAGLAAIPAAPAATSAPTGMARPARSVDVAATRVARPSSRRPAPRARRPARPGWERAAHGGQPTTVAERGGRALADVPGTGRSAPTLTLADAGRGNAASIPGLAAVHPHAGRGAGRPTTGYRRYQVPPAAFPVPATEAQQAFIREVAPGALATQSRYGIPASVTIAQAIDESGWGRSSLATQDHNLFGIKGNGPAGSVLQPTQEYENGQPVNRVASFRVYRNIAESIDDHGRLLATSGYYQQPMAERHDPNAFAAALTGTYATDPEYGAQLVSLMQRYDLYRYDHPAPAAPAAKARPGPAAHSPARHRPVRTGPERSAPPPTRASRSGPAGSAPVGSGPARPGPESSTPAPGERVSPATPMTPARQPPPSRSRPSPGAPSAAPDPLPYAASGGAASGAGDRAAPAIPGVPAAAEPAPAAPADPPSPDGAAARPAGPGRNPRSSPATQTVSAKLLAASSRATSGKTAARGARRSRVTATPYRLPVPPSVQNAFRTAASGPLSRSEPLYRDVAAGLGIGWQLLAACDWMECRAEPRCSPVHGEKLGTVNPDGTVYRTKSAALQQCADDLVTLARTVYRIDLTAPGYLSVRDLANAFAAFRWGGLLKRHRTSAMEFPYSVAGLTDQHVHMRWPNIDEPNPPDKPGGRFRLPFGAVPVVLGLDYPATA